LDIYGSSYNILIINGDVTFTFDKIPEGRHIEFTIDFVINTGTPPTILFPSTLLNPPTLPTLSNGTRVVLNFIGVIDETSTRFTFVGGTVASGGGAEFFGPWTANHDAGGFTLDNLLSIGIDDSAGAQKLSISGPLGVGARFSFVAGDSVFFTENITDIIEIDSTGLKLLTHDITMGTGGNIIAGGATEGMTNIGHLDFIDNTATPAAAISLFSDGTDLFANTGGGVKNLSDIASGATRALDNLLAVAINTSLLPVDDAVRNLGSASLHWRYVYEQVTAFKGDVTLVTFGIGNRGIGVDAAEMWFNVVTGDHFTFYENGTDFVKLSVPTANTYEIFLGPDPFTAGETYRIVLGENSGADGRISFTEGTGNDLLITRGGSGTTQGVQINSGVRFLSDRIRYLKEIDMNSLDITQVDNIKGDGANTGVIGELTAGDGGFNYFVRSAIQWEADAAVQITFDAGGLSLLTNGASDDIDILAQGATSDVLVTATALITINAGTIASIAGTTQAVIQGSSAQLICAADFTFSSGDLDINQNKIRFDATTVPSDPPATELLLFSDSTNSDHLSIRRIGSTVDLEAGGGASQTPITQDIDYDGFDVKDISNIEFRDTTGAPPTNVGRIWQDSSGLNIGSASTTEEIGFFLGSAEIIRFDEDAEILFVDDNHSIIPQNTALEIILSSTSHEFRVQCGSSAANFNFIVEQERITQRTSTTITSASTLQLIQNNNTPADFRTIANIDLIAENSSSVDTIYARISASSQDVTNATEDGLLQLGVVSGGNLIAAIEMEGSSSGGANDALIGFFGETPVVQQQLDSNPSNTEISTALRNLGFF